MTTEYLLNQELGHVLAALTPQNALIMEAVLQTGLRISDVLELKTEQLRPSMWVREKKTGKMHRCGLSKALLAQIQAQAGPEWAFPGTKPGTHKTPPGRLGGPQTGRQGLSDAPERGHSFLPQGLRREAHGAVREHPAGPAGPWTFQPRRDHDLRHGR